MLLYDKTPNSKYLRYRVTVEKHVTLWIVTRPLSFHISGKNTFTFFLRFSSTINGDHCVRNINYNILKLDQFFLIEIFKWLFIFLWRARACVKEKPAKIFSIHNVAFETETSKSFEAAIVRWRITTARLLLKMHLLGKRANSTIQKAIRSNRNGFGFLCTYIYVLGWTESLR
jgi:hypothetical protein